jgi:trk system potassium uptake protein TrkA
MRTVIVGGGKVGAFLARELRAGGYAVVVVERDQERARELAEESDALVVNGDGTDLRLLTELELRPDDFLLALTGADQDNLVACQLARISFGIERVLARLNDPRNRRTFEALEIPVVSVTDLIVQVISHEMDLRELVRVALLGRGEVSLFEVEIPEGAVIRKVGDVPLPPSSVLVAIRRDGEVVVPHGESELRPGDRVLVVTLISLEDEVRDCLLGELDGRTVDAPHAGPLEIEEDRE